jgi:predicted short-subunit dehydrogenase-like oxidoreductase (DUF2520 family)
MTSVAIVGAGHTGRALGRVLAAAGWRIAGVSCRTEARAGEAVAFIGAGEPTDDPARASRGAPVVLVTVPDDAIAHTSQRLEPDAGATVAHVCGALPAEALAAVRRRGAHAGALHPLRSFADPELAARRFAGTFCAIDGDAPAVAVLERLVKDARGVPLRVADGGKALYHAGAVFASNYVVSVMEAALRLFAAAGIPREAARAPLLALARGTLDNIEAVGIPAALTGPVERGDVETVRRHAQEIAGKTPDLSEAYAALARLACQVAQAKGSIDAAGADRIEAVL